ncbi:hypothetical protein CY34DRAFT_797906 [Suillus luteus UH-Slu-Lm8-n1]|uniref:Unplaced genomic scaffold CY34scaffold_5, whole genome shotgun sequence n=1 Tax=Suillus luteus UH-Slu-Lm8-n1 TaxID=930992 RepID=A0A0D0BGF5_9AGAM|nr:hypothetical protein CY34DRAFT_797906 [Suillus luteus UH-Slu-Lm8-n1]
MPEDEGVEEIQIKFHEFCIRHPGLELMERSLEGNLGLRRPESPCSNEEREA